MRVAFLNPGAEMGGAEVCLLDLLTGLRAAVPDWPLLLICGAPGPLIEKASAIGVATQVVRMPQALAALGDSAAGGRAGNEITPAVLGRKILTTGLHLLPYTWKLRRALADYEPDVVHTNGCKMHILGSCFKPKQSELLWHVHDYLSDRPLMS